MAIAGSPAGAQTGDDDLIPLVLEGDDITAGEDADGNATYTVPTAGTYDITVTAEGFTTDVFVLECPSVEGDLQALTDGDPSVLCNLDNLVAVSPEDGKIEAMFSQLEVSDCGLVLAAGDLARTESGVVVLGVAEPDPSVECVAAAPADAGYDTDADDSDDAGELAMTGFGGGSSVLVGGLMLVAGAMAVGAGRLFGRRTNLA